MIRILAALIFSVSLCYGQTDPIQLAKTYILNNQKSLDLDKVNINNLRVSDMHYSEQSGAHFIYLQQQYQEIDILNAITPMAVTNKNEVIISSHRIVSKIEDKIVHKIDVVTAEKATLRVLADLNIPIPKTKFNFQKKAKNLLTTSNNEIARGPIDAEKVYFLKDDALYLAWRVEIDSKFDPDHWSYLISTEDGTILNRYNHTQKCVVGPTRSDYIISSAKGHDGHLQMAEEYNDGAQYKVYPYFVESPSHGDRELIVNPADPIASPFGWHDTNGRSGPDTRITKGNNVHSFQDRDDDDESDNDEPDGGDDLIFDFNHDLTSDVTENLDADVTQVFYMSNFMHDWSYHLGFDEAAGNYQLNNLFRGGFGAEDGDPVETNSLDGFDLGQVDNANFSITSDGREGRMQLFNFEARGKDIFILSPEDISTDILTGTATFGPGRVDEVLEGKVVLVDDEVGDRTDGCEVIKNTAEINGNIALIRRGTCFFSEKVFNAQQFGAVAVIICNNADNEIINMAGAANANLVSIPAYFISKEDCAPIEKALKDGEEVSVRMVPNISRNFSSGFDNGIIAHEYAHGISGRLTGGASRASCLNNDEQMGEGWSDFVTLVLTQAPEDTGAKPRGIGTYVQGERPTGRGFRRFRYSTDMSVNPLTLNDIRGTAPFPHPLGEIWTSVLWDMYWGFIDMYGYDQTWTDESSGNYRAVRLVFDGMKLQPCSPGFIDGRDAILKADRMLFDGAHACLIWEVFTRRGMGFNAIGGSAFERNDNIENFETLPTCIKTLKIDRTSRTVANADDILKITVQVANHTEETLNDVVVRDDIPEDAEFVQGSSSISAIVSNDQITFALGSLTSLEEMEITYDLQVSSTGSSSVLSDDFGSETTLFVDKEGNGNKNEWKISQIQSQFGGRSYNIINDTLALNSNLTISEAVSLDMERPVFTFWHRYITEFGFDGGILEVSQDGGTTWAYVEDNLFIAKGYLTEMISNPFNLPASPRAFTGNSNGWIQSFVDLSPFKGREIMLRFRWASDQNIGVQGLLSGWFIDYVEIMDLSEVTGISCVSSGLGEEICDVSTTLLRSSETVSSTNDLVKSEYAIEVYPNPVVDEMIISLRIDNSSEAQISIYDLNGRLFYASNVTLRPGTQKITSDLGVVPEGTYLVNLNIGGRQYNQKIVKLNE